MGGGDSIIIENFKATERALRQQLDLVTKLLASLCEHIEKTSQLQVLLTIEDGKLARWWGKHKKIEADRKAEKVASEVRQIARAREEKERKDTRDKILKKLTPEDKKILGIS